MTEATTPAVAGSNGSITWIWTSFEGRIGRQTYWLKFVLPYIVALIVLTIVESVAGLTIDDGMGGGIGILSSIFSLIGIWFSLAAGAKRCHDRNRSGWFQAIALIPIIGAIWLLIELGFLKGTEGENRFGADPLA
jgi:uncharacterized membrane protein YhaH (DUF805 family)